MRCVEVFVVIFVSIIINLQFSLLAPILPLEIKRRQISQHFTGLIMGCMCVGYFICPYFVTELFIPKYGRRQTSLLGFVLMSSALLVYGLGYFIPDKEKALFVAYSMIARLIEGIGISTTFTAIVSLITHLFPNEIGFAHSARSLGAYSGVSIGLIAGAYLIQLLGYLGVFLVFSVLILLTSLLMFILKEEASREIQDQRRSISYCSVLKVRRVFMIVFFSLATDLLQYSLESTLALKLHTSFGFSRSTIGLYFGIFLLGTVSFGLAGLFFPEHWEKRKIVIVLLWINVVAPLLIGPSRVMNLPDNKALIGVGLFLGGSTRSLLGAYFMEEGVKGGVAQFPEEATRVGDLLSSQLRTSNNPLYESYLRKLSDGSDWILDYNGN